MSARQQRVLELMSQGMTNGQIARALKFSESTVRQETMAIYRYLQVPGRVEAVEVAIERGLLPQPDPVSAP
jgi:DNA-binding CsgD family transcriptional regulator